MVRQLTITLFMRGGDPCVLVKCGTASDPAYFAVEGGALITASVESTSRIDKHVVTITQDQLFELYRDALKNE